MTNKTKRTTISDTWHNISRIGGRCSYSATILQQFPELLDHLKWLDAEGIAVVRVNADKGILHVEGVRKVRTIDDCFGAWHKAQKEGQR